MPSGRIDGSVKSQSNGTSSQGLHLTIGWNYHEVREAEKIAGAGSNVKIVVRLERV